MKILRAFALLGAGWSLVVASASCQDRDVTYATSAVLSGPPDEGLQAAVSCVPGQTIECRGGCGEPSLGYQVCSQSGASYLPCVCPPLRLGQIPAIPSRLPGERRILPRNPLGSGAFGGTGGSGGLGSGAGPTGSGSGSASGAGSGVVGARCRSDADCIRDLECLSADGGELAGGGPAGGYCSMPCGNDAACAAVDVASECIGLAGQSLCVRSCASRAPAPNESKCLGRADVMCVSVAALGDEPPGTGPQPGLCVPACQSDAQCGPGLFCNLGNGLCSSTPPAGAPIGSACAAAEDCASGLCLTLNDTFQSFCSGFCSFGVPGCGFDGSEAAAGATCLLTQVRDEGPGDRGLCFASCDSDLDCRAPGAVCVPAESDGRAGVCLVPAEPPPLPTGSTPTIGNPCQQSSDCGAGLTCITPTSDFLGIPASPAGGYCASPCAEDSSCPEAGSLCVTRGAFSQCLRACNPSTADDCGGRDTLSCQGFAQGNPTRGFCAPSCSSDEQCGERVCDASGLCVEPAQPECEEDADCLPGELCLTDFGTCLPLSAECLDDAECTSGECDPLTNQCLDGTPECESDAQCADGVCDLEAGLCVPAASSCALDADCPGGVCDPSAAACIPAPPVPAGGECLEDSECAGELCASVDGQTSFCTGICLLGSAIGCEPYGSDAFCLLPLDPEDEQLGVCIELCNTAADCAQAGYECLPIGGTINGRSGGCLPPLPPAAP